MKVLTIHDDGTVEEVDLDAIGSFQPSFSPRERQVLDALAEGKRNDVIAADLGISLYGVKAHVREILGKLGAKNRTQVVTAMHHGGYGHAASVAALLD